QTPTPEQSALSSEVLDCVRTRLQDFCDGARNEQERDFRERRVRTFLLMAEGHEREEIRQYNGHESGAAAGVYMHHCRRLLLPVVAPCIESQAGADAS